MNNLEKYVGLLNDIAPEGEFLAYINKDEAEILKDNGALGLLTPQGIPSYIGGSYGSSGGGGYQGGSGAPGSAESSDRGNNRGDNSNNNNKNSGVDPGFQEALRKQAIRQADPVFGDPDPQVDVDARERDTITSFLDNYAANVKSNPFELGLIGALKTMYQTGQAKKMMRGTPGYEFLDRSSTGDSTTPTGGGGDRDTSTTTTQPTTTAPTTTLPPSMINQYFANMGDMGNALSSDLQTDYNNAKNNINSLLGITPPNQQFGYSADPYGGLMASNLTTNPYNIDYLRRLGLI